MDVDALAKVLATRTRRVFDLPEDQTVDLMQLDTHPPRGLARMESESVAALLGVGNHTDICAKVRAS